MLKDQPHSNPKKPEKNSSTNTTKPSKSNNTPPRTAETYIEWVRQYIHH